MDAKDSGIVLRYGDGPDSCDILGAFVRARDQLALFYDAPGGNSTSHMKRNIGLAWLELPLQIPGHGRSQLYFSGLHSCNTIY